MPRDLYNEMLEESPEITPLDTPEIASPSVRFGSFVDDEDRARRSGDYLPILPTIEEREEGRELSSNELSSNSLFNEMINEPPQETSFNSNHLTILDYLADASAELLAGVGEGATLQHAQFGEIGPDTVIGDIARVAGNIGGSILPYSIIAATLGQLGVFAGAATLPAVIGRSGLTAFTGRMFSRGDEEDDMLDRVEDSLIAAGIGIGLGSLPFALDKAILKFHGGPVKYMERMKAKLGSFLVNKMKFDPDDARESMRQFESEVSKQGGAKALNRAAIKRVVDGKKLLATQWTPLNRKVHAITGKKGLGLSKEDFHAKNIQIIGEAHTNKMNVEQLKELTKHYMYELRKYKGTDKFTPGVTPETGMTYDQMRESYTSFNPGIFSQNLPVERTMRRLGFQKLYDRVYDSKVISLQEQQGYDTVRRNLFKAAGKGQKKAVLLMMNDVKIPQNFGDKMTYGAYRAAAKKYEVNAKGVETATWMRSTFKFLLKRQNAILASEGKPLIVPRDAYVTNLIEDTAESMGGMTPELWASMKFSKNAGGFNRFLLQRFGRGNIVEDASKAHAAYTKAALKMIHLRPASSYVRNSIDAKTVLEGGTKKSLTLPRNVRQYIDDWLNHGVMEVSKAVDKQLNATLRYSAKSLAGRIKMAGYRGTLLGNPLSVIKNMTQQDLNIARLGRHWLTGIRSFNPKFSFHKEPGAKGETLNGWQFADRYCKLLQSRMPGLEGMDPTTLGYLTKIGFAPFKAVDKANIVAGFNGGFKKYISEGKNFDTSIKFADKLVRDTQFNYLNIDTPLMWLSAPGKLASQFQTWWTHFIEEVWSWGGTMPYGDGTGRILRIAKHSMNVAKSKEMMRFLGTNTALLYAMNKAGLGTGLIETKIPVPFMNSGIFPTSVPPSLGGLLGLGQAMYGITIGDENTTRQGISRVSKQIGVHTIPGYSTLRKIKRIDEGKAPVKSLFLPTSESEYKAWRGRD